MDEIARVARLLVQTQQGLVVKVNVQSCGMQMLANANTRSSTEWPRFPSATGADKLRCGGLGCCVVVIRRQVSDLGDFSRALQEFLLLITPRLVEAERAVVSTLAGGGDVWCDSDCLSQRL